MSIASLFQRRASPDRSGSEPSGDVVDVAPEPSSQSNDSTPATPTTQPAASTQSDLPPTGQTLHHIPSVVIDPLNNTAAPPLTPADFTTTSISIKDTSPPRPITSTTTQTMSSARDIASSEQLSANLANALSLSASPTSTFHSPIASFGSPAPARASTIPSKQLKPFNTGDIRILLLENVNETAREKLIGQGYQVEFHKASLPEDELIEKIRYVAPQHTHNPKNFFPQAFFYPTMHETSLLHAREVGCSSTDDGIYVIDKNGAEC